MTAASIAARLHGRKSGSGWIAKCPAHDDRDPSLSLRDVQGKVLVHCHAGCDQNAVVAALKSRRLWPAPDSSPSGRIVSAFDYTDENGTLLYQIVRLEPKRFRQRYPDGCGGWIWKKYKRQVLYRLREVTESPIVFVVEGEKDAETLRSHGFVATTNAGGALAPWLPQFTDSLRGREVILIPDNDQPGRKRVVTIARALLGNAARIVVLELPGVKDTTEWFDQGHSEMELITKLDGVAHAH